MCIYILSIQSCRLTFSQSLKKEDERALQPNPTKNINKTSIIFSKLGLQKQYKSIHKSSYKDISKQTNINTLIKSFPLIFLSTVNPSQRNEKRTKSWWKYGKKKRRNDVKYLSWEAIYKKGELYEMIGVKGYSKFWGKE